MTFLRLLIIPILFLNYSCGNDTNELVPTEKKISKTQDVETAKMVAELNAIANKKDNIEAWHLNKEKAQHHDKIFGETEDLTAQLGQLYQAGKAWLNAGNYTFSIQRLETALLKIKDNNIEVSPQDLYEIKELLGIAYLRKGEIENCIKHHNEYSCLIPIEAPGQHIEKEGAQKALAIFENLLYSGKPTPQVIWLYNITQMTLGGYPNKVNKNFLLPPSIFQSKVSFPRFKDQAMSLGLAINDISGSVVMDDFNNDYLLDFMVSSYGVEDQLRYFENAGDGSFKDRTMEAGLKGLFSGLNMVQADYNNDGYIDVYILRGAWFKEEGNIPNSLLRNNGDGTFTDVTHSSGLYCKHPTQTASWTDYNNDGWIDLFVGNEFLKTVNPNAKCQLFENQKDGTFKELAATKGLALEAYVKGCNWGDYDNDGNIDIYISNALGNNYLMKNLGPEQDYSFKNMSGQANTSEPKQSFPCWFFDYNQDGFQDLFVSAYDFKYFGTAAGEVAKDYIGLKTKVEKPRLYLNQRNGTFQNVASEAGLSKVLYTMGSNYGDLNNDGFDDFYAGTGTPDFRALIPNRMFLNRSGQAFEDISQAGGFGHLQKGHGVAFGDIDNDGDQDVYAVLGGAYKGDNFMNALFVNPGTTTGAWVKLKLKGVKSNAAAIGARVEVRATNDIGNQRSFHSVVSSGGSFGANPLCIEQGLGGFTNIKEVIVSWPGFQQQRFSNISVGNTYELTQGIKQAKKINIKGFELKEDHGHQHHHH